MLSMLVAEEQENEGTGPCMEYLLQHKILDTLVTLARTDVSTSLNTNGFYFRALFEHLKAFHVMKHLKL